MHTATATPETPVTVDVCALPLSGCAHVHIYGCPEINGYDPAIVARAHRIAVETRREVILDFCERDNLDPNGWRDILPRVTFFPCLDDLPLT